MSEYTDRAVSRIREAARLPFGSSGSQSAYAEAHALAATSTAIDLAELAALMRPIRVTTDAEAATMPPDLTSVPEGVNLSESAREAIARIIELDIADVDTSVVVYGATTTTTARLDAAAQMLGVDRKSLGYWLTDEFDRRPDDEDNDAEDNDDRRPDDVAYLDITPDVPDIFAEARESDTPPAAPKTKKKGGKK